MLLTILIYFKYILTIQNSRRMYCYTLIALNTSFVFSSSSVWSLINELCDPNIMNDSQYNDKKNHLWHLSEAYFLTF